MPGFILDTCVLSETSRSRPHPNVVGFIKTAPNLSIPAAALMEFQLGIMELCSYDPIKAVKLSAWYEQVLMSGMPVLETGKEVAEIWGTLASDRRLKNLIIANPASKRPRSGQDLHIAAVALVHRIPIATLNIRDFLLIDDCYPLPGIYNPLEDKWYVKAVPIVWAQEHAPVGSS